MFVYIKQQVKNLKRRCVINKITLRRGFYFEVLFRGRARPKSVSRAVRLCDPKGHFPIVCEDIPLFPKERKRKLSTESFDLWLLINTFSYVISGTERALIIDRDGRLCEHIEKPLTKVRTLYVLTRAPKAYERINGRLLQVVGASPVIIDTLSPDFPFSAVFSPFGTSGMCSTPDKFAIIGEGGYGLCGDEVIIKGKRCDRLLLAAIHKCIGKNETENALPCFLIRGERRCTPDGLRAKIKGPRFSP